MTRNSNALYKTTTRNYISSATLTSYAVIKNGGGYE